MCLTSSWSKPPSNGRAIEVITSVTRKYTYTTKDGEKKTVNVAVWNPTIANLSLMALGSSAPEILLSCIETIQTLGSVPGELGPSTIVGSAAFNLMVISAVSIISVGAPKKIDGLGVFAVTTSASMFAYIWMWIVLAGWTPNVVTIWEAFITLFFFFLLLALAFTADKIKWCMDRRKKKKEGLDPNEPDDI